MFVNKRDELKKLEMSVDEYNKALEDLKDINPTAYERYKNATAQEGDICALINDVYFRCQTKYDNPRLSMFSYSEGNMASIKDTLLSMGILLLKLHDIPFFCCLSPDDKYSVIFIESEIDFDSYFDESLFDYVYLINGISTYKSIYGDKWQEAFDE